MIIELFGPPAAGKTTLALALHQCLEAAGREVRLAASLRPGEQPRQRELGYARGLARAGAPFLRLAKIVTALPKLLWSGQTSPVTTTVLQLLPPRSLASRIRYRRYLSILERTWANSKNSPGLTIIDQGYMSAISSLVLHGRPEHRVHIEDAIGMVPKADLIVCLDAPPEILRERISQRLGRQTRLERMFEVDLEDNLAQRDIVLDLKQRMMARNASMIEVSCLDQASLDRAVQRICAGTAEIEVHSDRPIRSCAAA